MINANELRIGNLISDDEGVLAKVIGLVPFDHSVRCDEEEGCKLLVDCYHANGSRRTGCETDSPECNPIPITPEWLERCGFKYHMPYYIFKSFIVSENRVRDGSGNYDGFHMKIHIEDRLNSMVIKHLHQLQNLYFALTGEELNVEL